MVKRVGFKDELSKHCCIYLHVLVGLPEETLPHADSSYAKFNAARGDFPKLEDFLVGHASVYVGVRQWGGVRQKWFPPCVLCQSLQHEGTYIASNRFGPFVISSME